MATGWIYLNFLQSAGVFQDGKASLLDIGCQHLFDVPIDQGRQFARSNGYSGSQEDLDRRLADFAQRSKWPNWGLYLHEFLQITSLTYASYDIFSGPQTRIFDLNYDSLAPDHVEAFDVVMNFGTTEHVFNQFNSFKVIHEATKVGGYMFHQVPTVGYVNHGYWTYSPRTLLELAQANRYAVEKCWITGPQGNDGYPEKAGPVTWDGSLPENFRGAWDPTPVPNGLVNILLRKVRQDGFRLSLDTTTTADATEENLARTYVRDGA